MHGACRSAAQWLYNSLTPPLPDVFAPCAEHVSAHHPGVLAQLPEHIQLQLPIFVGGEAAYVMRDAYDLVDELVHQHGPAFARETINILWAKEDFRQETMYLLSLKHSKDSQKQRGGDIST